jgi:hypothetical protein
MMQGSIRALASILPAVFLAACDSGPGPAFTSRTLTHRGDVLVLSAAATPASASISCTGPVPAQGTGAVLDSVPVVHHDTARTFASICTARANGASAADTASYILYGPNIKGTWGGTMAAVGWAIVLDIGDEATPSRNSAFITPPPPGNPVTWLNLSVSHIDRDSVRILYAAAGYVFEGKLSGEYDSLVANGGYGTSARLTDFVVFARPRR